MSEGRKLDILRHREDCATHWYLWTPASIILGIVVLLQLIRSEVQDI